jgi:hypothetical protein
MNKLIIALCASAFAFGSASALAGNDMKPLSKMETQEAKAARDAAKAKWAKMTPDEQAAYRKNMAKKKQSELTALESVAQESGAIDNAQVRKDAKASIEASKATPAPTTQQRAAAGASLEKAAQDNDMNKQTTGTPPAKKQ